MYDAAQDAWKQTDEQSESAEPHHFLPAILADSSSDLGLFVKQVANEHQALGIEVDVLILARLLLQSSNATVSCHHKGVQ